VHEFYRFWLFAGSLYQSRRLGASAANALADGMDKGKLPAMRLRIIPAALLLSTSCSGDTRLPLPPLADGLSADVRQANAVFDQRVKTAFPVGSRESDMVATLASQGFEIGPPLPDTRRGADLIRRGGICQTLWSVRWQATGGTITDIFGVYGLRCP